MIVRILSSNLAEKVGKLIELDIEREMTIEDLKREIARRYDVEDEFSERFYYNFSVNGKLIRQEEFKTYKLKNSDEVIIMPSIAGGRYEGER
jgi:molybdopterin converting factor small subunit